MLAFLFWILVAVMIWGVGGYAALAVLWHRWSPRTRFCAAHDTTLPTLTLVIAAWNERAELPAKMANIRSLDYPRDRLRVLFVTDGSTDDSPLWLAGQPDVEVMHEPARRGKAAAMNRAMRNVNSEVVVFTDANTTLNREALRRIAERFADPTVGAVAGEKRVRSGSDAGEGEGLYWRYESRLKRIDAQLWSAAGAAGELFAVRTSLWETLPQDTLLDDFVVSLRIAGQGHRIAYADDAWASEAPSTNLSEEWKRKVRIAAGGLQSIGRLKSVWRYPRLAFVVFSHRVLRWTVIPASLPFLPVLAAFLWISGSGPVYGLAAVGMVFAATCAVAGGVLLRSGRPFGPLTALFYFAFMNAAAWAGALRLIRRRQAVTWERAGRLSPAA